MPLLRGCCTLDLQLGTKIIGIIFLILGLIGFLSTLLLLGAFLIIQDVLIQQMHIAMKEGVNNPNRDDGVEDPQNAEEITKDILEFVENNLDTVTIVLLVIVCQQLLDVICSSCLIHGIRKNRRGLLMPWVITHVLYLIIEVGIVVVFFVIMGYFPILYQIVLPVIAFELLWVALHIYLLLVVISQFQALGLIRMHDEMCMK